MPAMYTCNGFIIQKIRFSCCGTRYVGRLSGAHTALGGQVLSPERRLIRSPARAAQLNEANACPMADPM